MSNIRYVEVKEAHMLSPEVIIELKKGEDIFNFLNNAPDELVCFKEVLDEELSLCTYIVDNIVFRWSL